MDLWFATPLEAHKFRCSTCPEAVQRSRKCGTDSFRVLGGMRVDDRSLTYKFCPGKATWYPHVRELFEECRIAKETGILPKVGGLEDQSVDFADALPVFIERWSERNYDRIWGDVRTMTKAVLEAAFGKK